MRPRVRPKPDKWPNSSTEHLVAIEGYGGRIGAITVNVNPDPAGNSAPAITQQPRPHTRFQDGAGGGTNVTFQVVATGSLPLTYQWRRNSVALDEATHAMVTLTNVSAADAGVYQVVITNLHGSVTSAPVALTLVDAPFNDSFAQRLTLIGSSNTVAGSNLQASKEPDEPNHAGNIGGRSVWWTWTAPSNGLVSIDTFGSSFDTGLSVYEGSTIPSLSLVAENDDLLSGRNNNSFVKFAAVAGRQYQVAVDGFKTNGTHGSIILNLRQPPEPPRLNTQPVGQALLAGATLTLDVAGAGVTPLYQFQWFQGSDLIPGANSSSLVLPNVTLQQRGHYSVTVSNEFGVITSDLADIWIRLRPPVAQRLHLPVLLSDGRVQVEFGDPDGTVSADPDAFEVQSTSHLAGAGTVWTSHPGGVSLRDGKLVFEDPNAGTAIQRIYRVREK